MKLNKEKQKLILLGGAGLVGLYFITRPKDVEPGMMGGGGMSLLPGVGEPISGETAGAITYNIPAMPASPFGSFKETKESPKSKVGDMQRKYLKLMEPYMKALEKSERLGAPTAVDVIAYGKKPKVVPKTIDPLTATSVGKTTGKGIWKYLSMQGDVQTTIGGNVIDFATGLVGVDAKAVNYMKDAKAKSEAKKIEKTITDDSILRLFMPAEFERRAGRNATDTDKVSEHKKFMQSLYKTQSKAKKISSRGYVPGMSTKEMHEGSDSAVSYKTYKEQYKLMNP